MVADKHYLATPAAASTQHIISIERVGTTGHLHEPQRQCLENELTYRLRNAFALVQALALQTLDNSSSLDEFREAFLGRLDALARAHVLLLDTDGRGSDLRAVVERQLEPYTLDKPDSIRVDGISLMLSPKQGLTLGMVLHELTTNAVKHGALSHTGGRLAVSWTMDRPDGAARVRLRWEETDVPGIEAPEKRGFGTTLIEQLLRYDLDGAATLRFEPNGLRCELSFPLE